MDIQYESYLSEESGAGFDLDLMFPREQNQYQLLATPMNRSRGSGSSMGSDRSTGSYQDRNYAASPLSSCDSPTLDGTFTRRGSLHGKSQNSFSSPYSAAPSPDPSAELPLFNIEKDGDPNIVWFMYYDFIVTRAEAYYQLQSDYLPTNKYPSRVKSEKVIIDGVKLHPCGVPACKARPFTRHFDLERHFSSIHGDDKEQVKCDYAKCPHKEPFRKDHLREHYREYHAEDLIKRGQPKHNKPKRGQKKPETVEEFLAGRLDNVNLNWWRCSKCFQRVKVNDDGYMCPRCNVTCEAERLNWREKARTPANNPQAGDSTTNFDLLQPSYVTGCGQCENTWLPDKKDNGLWVSCQTCRPGIKEKRRF